jgi:flagellar hook-length control protein FliK
MNVSALAQPAAPHPAVTTPAQANTPVVQAPVGSARWGEQLANQVVVLVRDGTHTAHIQLTPPELGPVRAQISIADGVASVVLSASVHETREALDAALPALRDALAESGIALGETSVSDKRLGQQSEHQPGRPRGEPAAPGHPAHPPARRLSAGLLDVYA